MSATWSIANGRFDRLVACSSVPSSSGNAQDLMGTPPGLATQAAASLRSRLSRARSITSSETWLLDLRPALLTSNLTTRCTNENRPLVGGAGRKAAGCRTRYPCRCLRSISCALTASRRGHVELPVRRWGEQDIRFVSQDEPGHRQPRAVVDIPCLRPQGQGSVTIRPVVKRASRLAHALVGAAFYASVAGAPRNASTAAAVTGDVQML